MEVYLNKVGELACSVPDPKLTVADLVDAIIRFCDCMLIVQRVVTFVVPDSPFMPTISLQVQHFELFL